MENLPPQVPTYLLKFFKWFCKPEFHYDIEGDLLQLFAERRREKGLKHARRHLLWDVLLLFRPGIIQPISVKHPHIPFAMYRNYFKITWRSMRKQKLYTFLNIGGLAIGLTAFILIFLYVQLELSYDRFFPNSDQVYRIYSQQKGNHYLDSDLFAVTPAGLAPALERDYPEVEYATSVQARQILIEVNKDSYYEKGLLADPHVFRVLPFTFLQGDPTTCLSNPNTLVLTQSFAQKVFGDENPIDKNIRFQNEEDYTVTGLIQDPPQNSSLKFSLIASILSDEDYESNIDREKWDNNSLITFLTLTEGADPLLLQGKLPELVTTYIDHGGDYPFKDTYFVQSIEDLHLETRANFDIGEKGNPQFIRLFSWVAILLLVLACINYMNLAIARSIRRAQEVGLRKVIGAKKRQLISQFLMESIFIALLSLLLALALTHLLAPFFGSIIQRPIHLDFADNPWLLPFLIFLVIAVGLVSGSYPALVMSSLLPIKVLKGKSYTHLKGINLQRVLIIGQYAASITLIICSLVIYQQFEYIRSKELGYDKDHILTIPTTYQDRALRKNFDELAVSLKQNPQITGVTACNSLPTFFDSSTLIHPGTNPEEKKEIAIYRGRVGYEYLDVFGIELLAGRNFSKEHTTDKKNAFILNETAIKTLGNWRPEEAIGKQFSLYGGELATIIGVVKNFHMHTLHMEIEPVMLQLRGSYFNHIAIKTSGEDLPETINFIKASVGEVSPYPVNFSFLDEKFEQLYRSDLRVGKIFGFFTFMSFFIASLGLFGLAAFTVGRRTKEIGIRKVLGATAQNIVGLVSKDFLEMVVWGFFIAIPIAWYAMGRWLESFAYGIELTWWVFAIAGALATLLAFLTISSQSLKAAWVNPVECLVDE